MNGMCEIDPDRGPLARSIRPHSTPARWDWVKESRTVGPLDSPIFNPRPLDWAKESRTVGPLDSPAFKPSPLDWVKESRTVGPLMRRLTEPRFPHQKLGRSQFIYDNLSGQSIPTRIY